MSLTQIKSIMPPGLRLVKALKFKQHYLIVLWVISHRYLLYHKRAQVINVFALIWKIADMKIVH